MLNIFRQGGLIKTVMGGIVLALIVAFMLDYRSKGAVATTECVATVDGGCVDPKDYSVLLRLVGPSGASNKELKKTGFLKHTVDALVERELLLQEAKRLGISVSEKAIDDELELGRVHYSWPVSAPLPRALMQGMSFPTTGAGETVTYLRVRNSKTNTFDYPLYRRQLQSLLRMSPKEFKELQSAELVAARVRQAVVAPVRVAPDEAFFAYEQQRSTVTARFVELKNSWFERFGVALDPAAVKAFMSANAPAVDAEWEKRKAEFTAGCPLVSEIVFNYPSGADADARAETASRAEQALQLLKAGVSFEVAARALSDGSEGAQGGFLGCLSDKVSPVAEDLSKAVAGWKAGQVSTSALETPKGLHLLRFEGNLAAADVETRGKLAVASRLASERTASERTAAFAKQIIAAVQGGQGLKEALDAQTPGVITLDDAAPSAAVEKLLSAALAADTAPKFDISRAVPRGGSPVPGVLDMTIAGKLLAADKEDAVLPDPYPTFGGVAVIQLKEKDVATREAFEKDKDRVIEALLEQKRAQALAAYVDRLRAGAKKIDINAKFTEPAAEGKGDGSEDSG